MSYFIGLFLILFGIMTPLYSVANLTIPTTRHYYAIGGSDATLFPDLTFSYDATQGTSMRTHGNGDKDWRGGAIYVVIDQVNLGNDRDTLTCTLANAVMTSQYYPNERKLAITANATVTPAEIQTTLRSVKFRLTGGRAQDRRVRIWMVDSGFSYSPQRNGRLYGMVGATLTGADTFTYIVASADAAAQFRRAGLTPYFGTIRHADEQIAVNRLVFDAASHYTAFASMRFGTGATAQWRWGGTGPDKGILFKTGATGGATGHAPGEYNNWDPSGQPDGNATEIYLGSRSNYAGRVWHDFIPSDVVGGYILEYGGMPDDANFVDVTVINHNPFRLGQPY